MLVGLGIGTAASGHKFAAAAAGRDAISFTAFGDAQIDTSESQFGGSSGLFDGTGDYVYHSGTDAVIAGSNEDYTIEFWVYFNNLSGGQGLVTDRPPTSSGFATNNFYLEKNSSNTIFFGYKNGGDITGTSSVSASTWYHMAVVRSSGTTKFYLDGTQTGSTLTYTGAVGDGTFSIGAVVGQYLNGHIDELRVSTTARYTANFTRPSSAFTNDDDTLMLLHMNGTDGNTDFLDDNGVRAQTSLVGLGTADIDTAQSQFGGSSFYVDGTGGDGVLAYLPSNPSAITVEGWYKFDGVPSSKSCMFAHNRPGTGYGARDWFVTYNYVLNDWSLNIKDDTATTVTRINSTANDHEDTDWHHLAVCMEIGGYARLFIDGDLEEEVDISTYTFTDWTGGDNRIWLGHWYTSGNNHECYYDEFRISDTVRYTTSFTAPTAAFTNDDNTIMLLHADGTNGSTTFTDDNS